MSNEMEELTPQERQALAGLNREKMPPSFLEDRIVAQLKAVEVIRSGRPAWLPGYLRIAMASALLIAVFLVGAMVGARRTAVPNTRAKEPGFILIVRQFSPDLRAKTPEEELQRVREYGAWARELGRKGLLLGGEKLNDEGSLLSQAKGSSAIAETATPTSEGAVAGYFLLPASDYNQAVSIARTCPHIKHGGTVELRQIEH